MEYDLAFIEAYYLKLLLLLQILHSGDIQVYFPLKNLCVEIRKLMSFFGVSWVVREKFLAPKFIIFKVPHNLMTNSLRKITDFQIGMESKDPKIKELHSNFDVKL